MDEKATKQYLRTDALIKEFTWLVVVTGFFVIVGISLFNLFVLESPSGVDQRQTEQYRQTERNPADQDKRHTLPDVRLSTAVGEMAVNESLEDGRDCLIVADVGCQIDSESNKGNERPEHKNVAPDTPTSKHFLKESNRPSESVSEETSLADIGIWSANNAMVYAAVFQFVFAGVAIGLIWLSLRETREILREAQRTTKAANDTLEAAQNAERALLIPEFETNIRSTDKLGVTNNPRYNTGDIHHLTVSVSTLLRNVGRTVALYVQPNIANTCETHDGFTGDKLVTGYACDFITAIDQGRFVKLPDIRLTGDFDASKLVDGGPIITLEVYAHFIDTFGRKRTLKTVTEFSFVIIEGNKATNNGSAYVFQRGADLLKIRTRIISQI